MKERPPIDGEIGPKSRNHVRGADRKVGLCRRQGKAGQDCIENGGRKVKIRRF